MIIITDCWRHSTIDVGGVGLRSNGCNFGSKPNIVTKFVAWTLRFEQRTFDKKISYIC